MIYDLTRLSARDLGAERLRIASATVVVGAGAVRGVHLKVVDVIRRVREVVHLAKADWLVSGRAR